MWRALLLTPTLIGVLLVTPEQLVAQMIAGEVPTTHTLTQYATHLEPIADFTEAGADIDVDCDGQDDFKILLTRAAPYIDLPNRLYLKPLADSITICAADTSTLCSFNHAYLYPEGQGMSCPSPFTMLVDTSIVMGDYVTYTCGGAAPERADSVYIHYAKEVNGIMNVGWIMLSFNILSSDPSMPINPWADVHTAIGVCQGVGIRPHLLDYARIKLHPNPASEEATLVLTQVLDEAAVFIVYNALGAEVMRHILPANTPRLAFNTFTLAPAMYHYQVSTPSGVVGDGKLSIVR